MTWQIQEVQASTLPPPTPAVPKNWRIQRVDATVSTVTPSNRVWRIQNVTVEADKALAGSKKWRISQVQAIVAGNEVLVLPDINVEPGELVTTTMDPLTGGWYHGSAPLLLGLRGVGNERRFIAPPNVTDAVHEVTWEARNDNMKTSARQKIVVNAAATRVVVNDREVGAYWADGVSPWGSSFRRGYATVDDMLSRDRFYVAHRGGSVSYPEHSMFAYESSVMHGAGALELSLARTSDGVWVGNHDQTLARTTGNTADPSTLTWEALKAIRILGTLNNQAWSRQPHERALDILAAYAETHVFFIDPKYEQLRNRDTFFDLLDQVPNGREKIVIKYFYDNFSLATEARTRGYKTWGYYYATDVAQVASTHQYWDILGMEHSASQAVWDQMIATGKPVMGHITPSAAAAAAAFSKGARGVMTSNVVNVIPAYA